MKMLFCYEIWFGSPVFTPIDAAQARAKLAECLSPDCLAQQFTKRLPPDLQAKCDPADLAQDTLLGAWRNLDQFHGDTEEKLRHWVSGLHRNQRHNLVRGYRRTGKRQVGREVSLDELRASRAHGAEPVAKTLDPAALAIQREERCLARRAFGRLRAKERKIIWLVVGKSLTFEQAGERLALTSTGARTRYNRAVQSFKRIVQEVAGK